MLTINQIIKHIFILILVFFPLSLNAQYQPIKMMEMTDEDHILSADISPDGKYLVTGGQKSVIVWDSETGKEFTSYKKVEMVGSLAFSPDGKRIAIGDLPYVTKLFDIATGNIIKEFISPSRYSGRPIIGEIFYVAFTSNGKRLITKDEQIMVFWDIESGKLYEIPGAVLFGSEPIPCSNPNEVISGTGDGYIEIWDYEKTIIIKKIKGRSPILSSNKKRIVYGDTGIVKLYDLEVDREIFVKNVYNLSPKAISSEGNYIILKEGNPDKQGNLKREIYSINNIEPLRAYSLNINNEKSSSNSDDRIIKFFPKGNRFLTINGNRAYIWDYSDLTSGIPDAPEHK